MSLDASSGPGSEEVRRLGILEASPRDKALCLCSWVLFCALAAAASHEVLILSHMLSRLDFHIRPHPTCSLPVSQMPGCAEERKELSHRGQGTILGHRQHSWNSSPESLGKQEVESCSLSTLCSLPMPSLQDLFYLHLGKVT